LKQAISDSKGESALSYLFNDSIPGMVIIGGPGQRKIHLILLEYYKSQEEYEADMTELKKIINKTSKSISCHPHKLVHWIMSENRPFLEKYIDLFILKTLKMWLSQRSFSERLLSKGKFSSAFGSDIDLVELSLSLAGACLSKNYRQPIFNWQ
jgi:hypothetical protein